MTTVPGYGARILVVCTCGSLCHYADAEGKPRRYRCQWCGDQVWPPTDAVRKLATALANDARAARKGKRK